MMKTALLAGVMAMLLPGMAQARDVVIHAGRVIDGDGTERANVSIVIHDGVISAVEPGRATPAGAEVIDLSGQTVMPGMINMHVHVASYFRGDEVDPDGHPRTPLDSVLASTREVRRFVDEGFTTVRSLDAANAGDLALRRAIDRGDVPGPRVWASLEAISPTGGHGDPRNSHDLATSNPAWDLGVADGPDAVRAAIRAHKRRGANVIKIMPSGGATSIGDDPRHTLMSDDEIRTAVETAHSLGLKIAAHAQGKEAIEHSARLGVDSIEHGTLGDEATFKIMKDSGTYFVPTMIVSRRAFDNADESERLRPTTGQKAKLLWPRKVAAVKMAYKAGVKMAFGTDVGAVDSMREFALLREAGITNRDIVRMATGNAADLLGTTQVGYVRVGAYADLVAVQGDPLADIDALQRIDFVMKNGDIVRQGPPPAKP